VQILREIVLSTRVVKKRDRGLDRGWRCRSQSFVLRLLSSPVSDQERSSDKGLGPRNRAVLAFASALVFVFALVALVALLKVSDVRPEWQRTLVFVVVVSAVALVTWKLRAGPADPLTATATVVALCTVAVAGLTYVGVVDHDPQFGCVNTNGPLQATVSRNPTVIYSSGTAAAEPKGMLLRGCTVNADAWCVGAVHEDAIEAAVFDARWLVLSGERGYLPYGRTVGPALPEDKRVIERALRLRPPQDVTFTHALLDRRSGDVAVARGRLRRLRAAP
jgi:hypothetical protein